MTTILTHQSAEYQGGDILIINGEKSIFSGAQSQLDAQKLIHKVSISQFEKKIYSICKTIGTSSSLKIYISDSEELVVSSNFQSKDEKGRNISYDFYCDSIDDPNKVVRFLADDSRIAGMMLNPADIKTLNKYLTFYKNRVRNYTIGGASTLLFLWALIKSIIKTF